MGKATISPAAGTGLLAELGRDSGITWYDVLGVLPGATAEQVQYSTTPRRGCCGRKWSQAHLRRSSRRPRAHATFSAQPGACSLIRPAARALGFRLNTVRLTEHPLPVDGLVVRQSPGPAVRARRGSELTVQVWHPPARPAGSGRITS
jgi:hypothetical protein